LEKTLESWKRPWNLGKDLGILEKIVESWRRLWNLGEDCGILEKIVVSWNFCSSQKNPAFTTKLESVDKLT